MEKCRCIPLHEEAMAELPTNKRCAGTGAKQVESRDAVPLEQEAARESSSGPSLVKGLEVKSQGSSKKPLWAISRGRRGKVAPISEWTTICGWHFAQANNQVELTRFKELSIVCWQKCRDLHSLRDGIKGGVELAQLVEI